MTEERLKVEPAPSPTHFVGDREAGIAPPPAEDGAADGAREKAQQVAAPAKEKAQEVAGQAKEHAQAAAEQAKSQAAARVDEKSTQVGRQIGSQGEALVRRGRRASPGDRPDTREPRQRRRSARLQGRRQKPRQGGHRGRPRAVPGGRGESPYGPGRHLGSGNVRPTAGHPVVTTGGRRAAGRIFCRSREERDGTRGARSGA